MFIVIPILISIIKANITVIFDNYIIINTSIARKPVYCLKKIFRTYYMAVILERADDDLDVIVINLTIKEHLI